MRRGGLRSSPKPVFRLRPPVWPRLDVNRCSPAASMRLAGAPRGPTNRRAVRRRGESGRSEEQTVNLGGVQPDDPSAAVDRENAFGNPASDGLHAYAHPGGSGGQRLVRANSHCALPSFTRLSGPEDGGKHSGVTLVELPELPRASARRGLFRHFLAFSLERRGLRGRGRVSMQAGHLPPRRPLGHQSENLLRIARLCVSARSALSDRG